MDAARLRIGHCELFRPRLALSGSLAGQCLSTLVRPSRQFRQLEPVARHIAFVQMR